MSDIKNKDNNNIEKIILNNEERDRLIKSLSNPCKPTKALVDLFK